MKSTSPVLTPPVRVNVKLCGSIPRKDMADELVVLKSSLRPLVHLALSDMNASHNRLSVPRKNAFIPTLDNAISTLKLPLNRIPSEPSQSSISFDPPSWAVAGNGECRLEPVCEALGRQTPVDLTSKACFRIGRSPNSDVQLFHTTSSRKHSLIFHHVNGTCYIVDCGSAHGTYVNGIRIISEPKLGVVFPHKVKKGSLIRFGGPGSPTFILKSFNFKLNDVAEAALLVEKNDLPVNLLALTRVNTRLNALGQTAADTVRTSLLQVSKRRLIENDHLEEPHQKRMRCLSPPLSPEAPLRLVSPDLSYYFRQRKVTFSSHLPTAFYPALVTPDYLSGGEDN